MRKRDCGGTTPIRQDLLDLAPSVRAVERAPAPEGPRSPQEQSEREERIARYRVRAEQGLPLFD